MLIKPSKPILGWNSYDCFATTITENDAFANLDAFVKRLKPAGYEYFVLDAGWFKKYSYSEYLERQRKGLDQEYFIDEWGRYVASKTLFPNGLRALADACHKAGVKFGLHLMRGIPTDAVSQNTPIKGHPTAHARDIVDPGHQCMWCTYERPVNMDAPGAQEFYDSEAEYLLDNVQVDFVKFDDATPYSREIEAFAKALDKNPRPVVLSLSPGNSVSQINWKNYSDYASTVRITADIWDRPEDKDIRSLRWLLFEKTAGNGCWIDLDMVPFGKLQVNVPEGLSLDEAPLGCSRESKLSDADKRYFMTQYALSASPIIFGGDLVTSSDADIAYVTDPDILECNANGIVGKQVFLGRHIDVRRADKHEDPSHGWIGFFLNEWNRKTPKEESFSAQDLGFQDSLPRSFFDIWNKKEIQSENGILTITINPGDCVFLKF